MPSSTPDALTHLLARARAGDRAAASEVFSRLNGELREIAERLFAGELPGNTLLDRLSGHRVPSGAP
jgi:hypothetical protein